MKTDEGKNCLTKTNLAHFKQNILESLLLISGIDACS